MKAVVVTGYVEIPGHPRPVEEYDRLGSQLGQLRGAPVRVFRNTLESCWLEPFTHALPDAKHCVGDNPKKNTIAYHIVQHQKTAWLLEAAETDPRAEILVWLDYGILHQPGVTPSVIDDFLRHVRQRAAREIAIPGAWSMLHPNIPEWPNWRFCGSSLVIHRDLVGGFHHAVRAVTLARLANDRRVTWEINDWAEVEQMGTLPIRWYAADHDQTQFTNYAV